MRLDRGCAAEGQPCVEFDEYGAWVPLEATGIEHRAGVDVTMHREQLKADLIGFLSTIQRPDRPIEELDETESLVDSGLIDSLALLEIILYLERTHGVNFDGMGFDPDRIRSVAGILDLIEAESL